MRCSSHCNSPDDRRREEKEKKRKKNWLMEWRKWYLDLVLVPLGLLFFLVYHLWLWYTVRSKPLHTIIGINSIARRLWVIAMMKVYIYISKLFMTLRLRVVNFKIKLFFFLLANAGLRNYYSAIFSERELNSNWLPN